MAEESLVFVSAGPEETRRMGEEIGRRLEGGAVVALEGELGSGKTCLIQGIAAGLGMGPSVVVNSPSYVIIKEYEGPISLYHFDLYRLDDEREIHELGWGDYLSRGGVVAVEWAERARSLLPPGCIRIRMEIAGETQRRITIYDDEIAKAIKMKRDERRRGSNEAARTRNTRR